MCPSKALCFAIPMVASALFALSALTLSCQERKEQTAARPEPVRPSPNTAAVQTRRSKPTERSIGKQAPKKHGKRGSKKHAAPPATVTGLSKLDQACPTPESALPPLQVAEFQFTSGIEKRKPQDELSAAKPGQRVYAYLTMNNRSGPERCLTVSFRIKGKKRSRASLKIGKSPTWRTWAYVTINKADAPGELEVEVADETDKSVLKKKLAILSP